MLLRLLNITWWITSTMFYWQLGIMALDEDGRPTVYKEKVPFDETAKVKTLLSSFRHKWFWGAYYAFRLMQLRPSGLILVKMDTGYIFHCLRDKEIRASNGLGSLSPKNCSNQCSTRSVKASDSFCSLLFGTVHYRSLQCRVGALHLIYLTTQLLMFHTLTLSNLLTATINCVTPSDLTSRACSRVWPPASKPDSNSPVLEPTTKIATSALDQTQEHDKWMTSSKISSMTHFTDVK